MTELQEMKQQLDRIETATLLAAKNVLSIDEVSYLTGFKKPTIYELTSKNKIPHSKRGGRLFFAKTDIEDWLMENRRKSQQEIQAKAQTYITLKK